MELLKILLGLIIVLSVATAMAIVGGTMAYRIYKSDEI